MEYVDFFNPLHNPTDKARELARQLMIQSVGQPVYVRFLKRDGTERRLQGRLGVRDHLKDPEKGDPQAADTPELITIYDDVAKGYRSINVNRILEVKAVGIRVTITS